MSSNRARGESEQRAFVEAAEERARCALESAGRLTRRYTLAGRTLQIHFAGEALLHRLAPALEHGAAGAGSTDEPDATIIAWDSQSTGLPNVPPPCARRDFSARGDIWGFTSERHRVAFHWGDSSVNTFDAGTATGVYWVEAASAVPYWVRASPFRSILHWWTERNGCQLVHGAAVGTEQGALLLTGKSGVGKSTTALACLLGGLGYLADDYVVVSLAPSPTLHTLYGTAKLEREQLARLPELGPLVTNPGALEREKALLLLQGRFAESLVRELPLVAIATPSLGDHAESKLVPASREVLKRAAAFTTLEQLPYAGGRTRAFIERLVDAVPSYELELGRELRHIPSVVRSFLTGALRRHAAPAPRTGTDRPLVSVVIPTYNGAKFLPEAIDCVIAQGYPELEVIVVNDGSTDDTDAVVARLPLEVRYLKYEEKAGPSEARNRGIREALGEYLAFLDVDDLWPERNLPRLMDHLLAYSALDVVHGYGHVMELEPATGRYELRGNPRETFPFYIGAGLYRRRAFATVGLFDARLEFAEDTDWYNRARELACPVERLDEVTLFVRRHGQNMTAGKSPVELNVLRAFKLALDRKRARQRAGGSP